MRGRLLGSRRAARAARIAVCSVLCVAMLLITSGIASAFTPKDAVGLRLSGGLTVDAPDVKTAVTGYGVLKVNVKNNSGTALTSGEGFVGVYRNDGGQPELVDYWPLWDESYAEFYLDPGTYYVWSWHEGYVSEWYQDQSVFASATAVTVTDGGTRTIDMRLGTAATGYFRVQVSWDVGAAPLGDIWVDALPVDPTGMPVTWGLYGDATDAAGSVFFEVPAGDYILSLWDWEGVYASEYYKDAMTEGAAQRVPVSGGSVADISASLGLAGKVGGANYDKNGKLMKVAPGDTGWVEAYAWDAVHGEWSSVTGVEWDVMQGTYTLEGLAAGTYRLVSYAWNSVADDYVGVWYDGATSATKIADATDVVVTAGAKTSGINFKFPFAATIVPRVNRVSGSNRYATSVAVSKANFRYADTVVVASGDNFPDALSASGLAGVYGAPLLLTNPGELPEVVAAEIERLGAEKIIVVGGTKSVSAEVAAELAWFGSVQRIAGSNRFLTAAAVANEVVKKHQEFYGYKPSQAFVVRGNDFADALAVSPFAFAGGIPVLLTETSVLPSATYEFIKKNGIEEVVIAGGTGAVSTAVASKIDAIPGVKVKRVQGSNRYNTAAAVARWGVDEGLGDPDFIGFATGTNFPDALGGGVACGANWGVLLMTDPNTLSGAAAGFVDDFASPVTMTQVYGGTKAVSDGVKAAISKRLPAL